MRDKKTAVITFSDQLFFFFTTINLITEEKLKMKTEKPTSKAEQKSYDDATILRLQSTGNKCHGTETDNLWAIGCFVNSAQSDVTTVCTTFMLCFVDEMS